MAQMASQQKNFMVENSDLFEETPSGLRERLISTTEWEEETKEDSSYPVCLGPNRSQASPTETNFTCILCQEEEDLRTEARTLVMAAFVQKSTVLSRRRNDPLPPPDKTSFPFLAADLAAAPHTSSCGHGTFTTCLLSV